MDIKKHQWKKLKKTEKVERPPMFMDYKSALLKYLSKLIYKFKATLIKIWATFFTELEKQPKYSYEKSQKTPNLFLQLYKEGYFPTKPFNILLMWIVGI